MHQASVLCLFMFHSAARMGSRHFPARTVLFERELNGVTYRVPALLYIHCVGKLLAFAEERLSADDAHANLLVLRRGSFYRNSVEWEDMRALETATLRHHRSMNPCPVYDEFTGIVFLFFIAVLGKTPEAYQIITGHNAARLCYVASSDQGLSWSKVTDLTEQVIGRAIEEWATFALGPGHGIQLKSGRLLVPAYAYHIDCKECFGKLCKTTPHSFTFYSDDHGQTWHYGEYIPNLKTGECQLASVDEEDGSNVLYCNARSPLGFRVQALSTDDGAVFHLGQLVPRLVEPPHGCQGSIIGFPAPLFYSPSNPYSWQRSHGSINGLECPLFSRNSARLQYLPLCNVDIDTLPTEPLICQPQGYQQHMASEGPHPPSNCSNETQGTPSSVSSCRNQGQHKPRATFKSNVFHLPTWLLYSHPTSPRSRINMGIYLSTFPRDAESWTEPWVIYEGHSAYSDLAYIELPYSEFSATGIPTIAFGCLYENGIRSPYEQISFSLFTLYEVIQNIPLKSTLPYCKLPLANKKKRRKCCVIS
ncbi:sialidase-4 [Alligator mississippiensis]|uniref:exo-alpha-sialidase n=1 Tax=Alligator mississippiensis TaxID=8496 RepID=A0A151MK17_ALLMI|nr:sialidase-4 [Alligator mississippiensis]KYO24803.1 sialidase-4 [Alligator mississippiensis]